VLRTHPRSLVRQYERGDITLMELRTRLVQAANHCPPDVIAAAIPAEELAVIQQEVASPPATVEVSPRIFAMEMSEKEMEEQRQAYYDGTWRWHRYFNNPNRKR